MDRKIVCLGCWIVSALFVTLPLSAEPKVRDFVLIVANNKSLSLSEPDLQYADDDAARYYRLFRSVAAESDVVLLTQFDRASRALYPELVDVAQPPSRAALETASTKLGTAVALARASGQPTRFYFVFAGHGNVVKGRGHLELSDGSIDGDFIEHKLLERIVADDRHLLLDSCNSFFVINPRKPGGRRWATPKDMALGFSARHPDVGLFLSTNSDSEVFEWSEIESGVFSHEVRSGLSGGADANSDGQVSYSELAGFVENANASIPRESLRPHLFFRGPHGNTQATLFPTSSMTGRRIALDSTVGRLWVKNASGGRVIDIHKESAKMTLVVPEAESSELTIYEEKRTFAAQKPTRIEHLVAPGNGPITLAELSPRVPEVGARGDRLFGAIFESPYGPVAYAKFIHESAAAPEPVYGLTDADLTRMDHYLAAMAGQDRTQRVGVGLSAIGLGTIAGGLAAGLALHDESRKKYPMGIATAGALSLGTIGFGLYYALTNSPGENALESFRSDLNSQRGKGAQLFVRTESWLAQVASQERTRRQTSFWLLGGMGLALATLGTIAAVVPDKKDSNPYMLPAMCYSEAAMLIGLGAFVLTQPTPTERMLNLYHDDPGLKVHFGVAPTNSGVALGFWGLF